MPQRRFPRPWRFEPIPGGYRVIDANGVALAHVYGQPPAAIAFSDQRLTDDEAERVAQLIVKAPERRVHLPGALAPHPRPFGRP